MANRCNFQGKACQIPRVTGTRRQMAFSALRKWTAEHHQPHGKSAERKMLVVSLGETETGKWHA
jgi:hypothetical protein